MCTSFCVDMFSFFLGVCLRVELLGHMVTRTGFPSGSVVMNPPAIAGDVGSVPVLEGSPREGNGSPLQYAGLGHPTDKGAWRAKSIGSQRVRHDLATTQQQWWRFFNLLKNCQALPQQLPRSTSSSGVCARFLFLLILSHMLSVFLIVACLLIIVWLFWFFLFFFKIVLAVFFEFPYEF